MRIFVLGGVLLLACSAPARQQEPYQTPLALDEMAGKQAVVETSHGTFVIQLMPEAAPNHVGYFMKLATEGAYAGTIFHRVVRYGLIQGGDPLSVDPSKAAEYGTGGLDVLQPEISEESFTAGAVGAVLVPGRPDSGGAQFFVCAIDQLSLDGRFTVFGRIAEGLEVVLDISAAEADAEGRPTSRITIGAVTIRDTPPVPFVADSPEELSAYRATLETAFGAVELEMLGSLAPETVRNFLRLADAGVYDGVQVHRVVPGFVIQTGALAHRGPLTASQQALIHPLEPEFSDTPNVAGIVSMARGDDPTSATTSFFICVGDCRGLDGEYTVFARVVSGMEAVRRIEAVDVDGETPRSPVVVERVVVSGGTRPL
jgi:peptidyl-prolyl cis-trans isomerase B (cyclophilin B)